MRKKVLTLKEARPAIKNLIRDMKKKYGGRNIQFLDIVQLPDDYIQKNLPSKAKKYLEANPNNVRKSGKEEGIRFYYYKLKTDDGSEIFILPILIFSVSRNNNSGQSVNRLLVCSLDTYLPKLTKEDFNELDDLLNKVIKE